MAGRPKPTPEVAGARRYAARWRMLIGLAGGALLAAEPQIAPQPLAIAAAGFGVIFLTGLFSWFVAEERWFALEECLSCFGMIAIVGWSVGEVTVLSVLWLAAAVTGVLARGGRTGSIGRVLVVGTLFSPLVVKGGMSAEALGFAFASISVLLASGRISVETHKLLDRARFDASHDSLTGLLSRGAFRTHVDLVCQTASEDRPAALISVDLNDFGAINKRLGHAAGDRVLREAAVAMRDTLREGDAIGRIGGDEFAAFVFCDDPEPVALRLCAALDRAGTSCTIGTARAGTDGANAEALLAAADVALRLTKRNGGTAVGSYEGAPMFSETSDGAVAALERLCAGDGLSVAVQPIVNVKTGRAHAYEALARFLVREERGPLHWFALADEIGVRADLELACLRKAIGLLDDVPDGARLAVNLSAAMLADRRTDTILDQVRDPDRLILEITEDTLVRHGTAIEQALNTLRARGIHLAVDDVGAGYSGLSQLAVLKPAYVKVDRGLIRGVHEDPARIALLGALADYAQRTGAFLVAEGVETEAELDQVRAVRGALVQGYLVAKPAAPWPSVNRAPFARRAVSRVASPAPAPSRV